MINHKLDRFGFSAVPFDNTPGNPFLDASRESLVQNNTRFYPLSGIRCPIRCSRHRKDNVFKLHLPAASTQ